MGADVIRVSESTKIIRVNVTSNLLGENDTVTEK